MYNVISQIILQAVGMETLLRKEKGSDYLFGGQQAHSAFSKEKPQTAETFPWHFTPSPLHSPTSSFPGICLQPFPGLGKAVRLQFRAPWPVLKKTCELLLSHFPCALIWNYFLCLELATWTSVALVAPGEIHWFSRSQDCLGGKSPLRSSSLTINPPLIPVPEHTQGQICQALTVTPECWRHQRRGFEKLFLHWAIFPIDP